jgi:Ca2+-transporting ATPase
MDAIIRLQSGRYHLFLKSASKVITKKCTHYVAISKNPDYSQHTDPEVALYETARDNISRTATFYTNLTLRTTVHCYRDFESWSPAGAHFHSPDEASHEDPSRDMILVTITGMVSKTLFVLVSARLSPLATMRVSLSRCVLETMPSPLA